MTIKIQEIQNETLKTANYFNLRTYLNQIADFQTSSI